MDTCPVPATDVFEFTKWWFNHYESQSEIGTFTACKCHHGPDVKTIDMLMRMMSPVGAPIPARLAVKKGTTNRRNSAVRPSRLAAGARPGPATVKPDVERT